MKAPRGLGMKKTNIKDEREKKNRDTAWKLENGPQH